MIPAEHYAEQTRLNQLETDAFNEMELAGRAILDAKPSAKAARIKEYSLARMKFHECRIASEKHAEQFQLSKLKT